MPIELLLVLVGLVGILIYKKGLRWLPKPAMTPTSTSTPANTPATGIPLKKIVVNVAIAAILAAVAYISMTRLELDFFWELTAGAILFLIGSKLAKQKIKWLGYWPFIMKCVGIGIILIALVPLETAQKVRTTINNGGEAIHTVAKEGLPPSSTVVNLNWHPIGEQVRRDLKYNQEMEVYRVDRAGEVYCTAPVVTKGWLREHHLPTDLANELLIDETHDGDWKIIVKVKEPYKTLMKDGGYAMQIATFALPGRCPHPYPRPE